MYVCMDSPVSLSTYVLMYLCDYNEPLDEKLNIYSCKTGVELLLDRLI